MSAVAFIAFPLFTEVYPWFLVCKILTNVGTVLFLNAPFLPDYFDHGSIGLASSYVQISQTIATLVSNSGVPYINSKLNDIKWVFYGIGILTFMCAVLLVFGLKEVVMKKNNGNEVDDVKNSD